MKIQRICLVLKSRKDKIQQTRTQMDEVNVHSVTVGTDEILKRQLLQKINTSVKPLFKEIIHYLRTQ